MENNFADIMNISLEPNKKLIKNNYNVYPIEKMRYIDQIRNR